MYTALYLPLLVLPGTAQVPVLLVLDCGYWYCVYVDLLVVVVVGVHGCIISHMYTPHFRLLLLWELLLLELIVGIFWGIAGIDCGN
eukprot:SAG31_NODE_90_length_26410_cov_175.663981_11_plen_86_part_00